ncbi:MAG: amidase [Mesorhizobium sp.]
MGQAYDVHRPHLRSFSARVDDFRSGRDTPRHFLERSLQQISDREGEVKAFVSLDVDNARLMADDASIRYREARARSPVDGMPVGIKDIIETINLPTEMNSPIYAGYQSRRDAACVVALKAAGAIVLGKTVTTEFACGRAGPTRNPYDASLTPGGSSSGSAAAVGAGMVPGAIGTQTQASVIRPASYCGAFALKPSQGLLRFDGCAPLAPTMDTLGLFGASLDDAWSLAAAIAAIGPDLAGPVVNMPAVLPPPIRPSRLVRLDMAGWSELSEEDRDAFEKFVSKLTAAGVEIVDRHASEVVAQLEQALLKASSISMALFAYESQWPLRAYATLGKQAVGERVLDLIATADTMTADDYRAGVAERDELRRQVEGLARACDGFLTLASSGPAIADISFTGSRSFPVPWSLIAGPSFALPLLSVRGLPLGVQLAGARGTEVSLGGTAAWITNLVLNEG